MAQKIWAPSYLRKEPETFCCTLILHTSRSTWVVDKGDAEIIHYGQDAQLYVCVGGRAGCYPIIISRTGFSAELGFEIYLHDAMLHADDVWPYILEQGEEFNLGVIAPSHIRRIEAGILSYGQDMDIENNPYEVRLGWQVDLDKGDFIGKEALTRIKQEGVNQRLVGLRVGGEPIVWYNEDFYLVKDNDSGDDVGYVTSAFWSPIMGSNIALAVLPRSHWKRGTQVKVQLPADGIVDAEVVRVPLRRPDQGAAQDGVAAIGTVDYQV